MFTSTIRAALALTLCGSLCSLSFFVSAASVWKVSQGDNTVYLGGTLHILSPDDYPLPGAYASAYEEAQKIVFETDLAGLNSPDFLRQTMALMMYQDGKTLKDDLSADTFAQLSGFLAERNIPIDNVIHMKPSMLGISLSMLEMKKMGLTSQGVDNYYFTKATEDKKSLEWFETPNQQLHIISRLGAGDEDAYIRYTLDDLKTMPAQLTPMKTYWREGDVDALFDDNMQAFKQDYPAVYADVLTNRNSAWLPKIIDYLSTSETEFVLVGTMHMAGPDGLLSLLKQHGYRVTEVSAAD